jgi:hypothetical protein
VAAAIGADHLLDFQYRSHRYGPSLWGIGPLS